ncbi:hypothetical protein FRC03_003330, partial [Tulasnella sp. 419]
MTDQLRKKLLKDAIKEYRDGWIPPPMYPSLEDEMMFKGYEELDKSFKNVRVKTSYIAGINNTYYIDYNLYGEFVERLERIRVEGRYNGMELREIPTFGISDNVGYSQSMSYRDIMLKSILYCEEVENWFAHVINEAIALDIRNEEEDRFDASKITKPESIKEMIGEEKYRCLGEETEEFHHDKQLLPEHKESAPKISQREKAKNRRSENLTFTPQTHSGVPTHIEIQQRRDSRRREAQHEPLATPINQYIRQDQTMYRTAPKTLSQGIEESRYTSNPLPTIKEIPLTERDGFNSIRDSVKRQQYGKPAKTVLAVFAPPQFEALQPTPASLERDRRHLLEVERQQEPPSCESHTRPTSPPAIIEIIAPGAPGGGGGDDNGDDDGDPRRPRLPPTPPRNPHPPHGPNDPRSPPRNSPRPGRSGGGGPGGPG